MAVDGLVKQKAKASTGLALAIFHRQKEHNNLSIISTRKKND